MYLNIYNICNGARIFSFHDLNLFVYFMYLCNLVKIMEDIDKSLPEWNRFIVWVGYRNTTNPKLITRSPKIIGKKNAFNEIYISALSLIAVLWLCSYAIVNKTILSPRCLIEMSNF